MTKKRVVWAVAIVLPLALFLVAWRAASWRPQNIAVDENSNSIEVSPDGRWLLSRRSGGGTWVGSEQKIFLLEGKNTVTFRADRCSWTPNSQILSQNDLEENRPGKANAFLFKPIVRLFSPNAPDRVQTFQDSAEGVNDAAGTMRLNADGTQLFLLTRFYWRRFDVKTGRVLERKLWRRLKGNWTDGEFLSLSPDGSKVLGPWTGTSNQMWDLKTGRVRTLKTSDSSWFVTDQFYSSDASEGVQTHRVGNDQTVLRLAMPFSEGAVGGRFIPVDRKTGIAWFDLQTTRFVDTTRRPAGGWNTISFSPDRRWAYTLEPKGLIRRWRLK